MWLSHLFSTPRDVARLECEITDLRARLAASEKKNETLNEKLLGINQAWADRFLTTVAKAPAIGDEVAYKVAAVMNAEEDAKQLAQRQEEFLLAKKLELEEDAREAGESPQAAADLFQTNYRHYIEEFRESIGFNN